MLSFGINGEEVVLLLRLLVLLPVPSPGGEALHGPGVQVPRRQRLVQRADLLARHGRLPARRRPPAQEVRRRRAGGGQPVRHRVRRRARALQTARQERPGVLGEIAGLLRPGPRVRYAELPSSSEVFP